MLYLIPFTVFCTALLLCVALYGFFSRRSTVAQRLLAFLPAGRTPRTGTGGAQTWAGRLSRIGERVPLSPKEHSRYGRALVAAGLRRSALQAFMGGKMLLAALLPLPYLLLVAAAGHDYLSADTLLFSCGLAATGYLLPSCWLNRRVKRRQEAIFHALPDLLDLVTLCVEAGLSMDAALIRASGTPQFDDNPLALEVRRVTMETRAGKPRMEALKDMAQRTMVDDLRAFASVLAQTERFGTGLGQALRSFSDELRTRRRQLAEEAAAKTTVKLIFPLVFAIFPALLVVVLGPAVVQIAKAFR